MIKSQLNIRRIAVVTGLVLLIPLIAMQFSNQINWTLLDFITAGILLFGSGVTYALLVRKAPRYQVAIAIAVALMLLLVWAELAVGIFAGS